MVEGAGNSNFYRPNITMQGSEVGNNPNEKNSSEEYFAQDQKEEDDEKEFRKSEFVDRSAQLRATLSSLASLNAASVINMKNKGKHGK